jgi:hypothetical protein
MVNEAEEGGSESEVIAPERAKPELGSREYSTVTGVWVPSGPDPSSSSIETQNGSSWSNHQQPAGELLTIITPLPPEAGKVELTEENENVQLLEFCTMGAKTELVSDMAPLRGAEPELDKIE